MLHFGALEDLLEEIPWDHFEFLKINELTYELSYAMKGNVKKRVEFYYLSVVRNKPNYAPYAMVIYKPFIRDALDNACFYGDMEAVKWIIQNDEWELERAFDPLQVACEGAFNDPDYEKYIEIMKFILSLKSDLNASSDLFMRITLNRTLSGPYKLDVIMRVYEEFKNDIKILNWRMFEKSFERMIVDAENQDRIDVIRWINRQYCDGEPAPKRFKN